VLTGNYSLIKNKKMKKTLVAFILANAIASAANAQEVNSQAPFDLKERKTISHEFPATDLNGNAVTINNVSTKAVRSFLQSHKRAENVHWYIETDGFLASYFLDGIKGRAFYNKSGNEIYDWHSYAEKWLPENIRDLIKSIYYLDYAIRWVNEFQTGGKIIYIVNLEGKTTWTNIRLCEGEMEVINEFDKK
jgi:hypothetical protein